MESNISIGLQRHAPPGVGQCPRRSVFLLPPLTPCASAASRAHYPLATSSRRLAPLSSRTRARPAQPYARAEAPRRFVHALPNAQPLRDAHVARPRLASPARVRPCVASAAPPRLAVEAEALPPDTPPVPAALAQDRRPAATTDDSESRQR